MEGNPNFHYLNIQLTASPRGHPTSINITKRCEMVSQRHWRRTVSQFSNFGWPFHTSLLMDVGSQDVSDIIVLLQASLVGLYRLGVGKTRVQ